MLDKNKQLTDEEINALPEPIRTVAKFWQKEIQKNIGEINDKH